MGKKRAEEKKVLDEEAISDLILCDPITKKGKISLGRLGLSVKTVSPDFFYKNLYVNSKYDTNEKLLSELSDGDSDSYRLYCNYTVNSEQFYHIKECSRKFFLRFNSDVPNEHPLYMLGVAGNGKSIEVNRRIREIIHDETKFESGRVYIDLADSFTKLTYGSVYEVPDNTPLWLFCIKLLDGIMHYIQHCGLCSQIYENFNKIMVPNYLATDEYKELFKNIGNYCEHDNNTKPAIFKSLKSFLHGTDAKKDIRNLLEVLMYAMYCSEPNNKHYIIFDNIEQYIDLNNVKIQIQDSDIPQIYDIIHGVVLNVTKALERIEENLGWKAFKIIIALRRTSLGLLSNSNPLQTISMDDLNINDMTGHFQVSEIWKKKKEFIWEKLKLKDKFNDDSEKLINIVDIIIADGVQATGTDYQSIIAPLMSYGIRRNAKAQAHAAYITYKILINEGKETIDLDRFDQLMSQVSHENNAVKYMFRRALIESQFKWSIGQGNRERWKRLNIGHLKESTGITKNQFEIHGIEYDDHRNVTLVRRILTFLSYFPDVNNKYGNSGKAISEIDMFTSISLYKLIEGVLINPLQEDKISDDDFLQFAKVLLALGDMSHVHTKSAPYVILAINDKEFHSNTAEPEAVLAEIMKKIWKAGKDKSNSKDYISNNFSARITTAGYTFLLDWQASYSFMASLHCYTIPSLFFLKGISSIKYVIETVFNASLALCNKYRAEAERFCGANVNLKTGMYLLKRNGEYFTFSKRLKELHIDHLTLYKTYIEKNYKILGLSEDDKKFLLGHNEKNRNLKGGFINTYIYKYRKEIGEEGCF